jgi:hypothetical protein
VSGEARKASRETDPLRGARLDGLVPARPDPADARGLVGVRTARRDGQEVVALRCSADGGGYVVECEVYPVQSRRVEPLRPGPYSFETAAEARAFLEEATRALVYLSCDVS